VSDVREGVKWLRYSAEGSSQISLPSPMVGSAPVPTTRLLALPPQRRLPVNSGVVPAPTVIPTLLSLTVLSLVRDGHVG
jgi:hypothetical protein